jgi:hypothetical protein
MTLRQTVLLVALLNLAYFGVEFAVAIAIGSVSLFADSVDFLEDASLNLLIATALGWSAPNRGRLGMALAAILLIPVLATLWTAWQKFAAPVPSTLLAPSCSSGSAIIAGASRVPPSSRRATTPTPMWPSSRRASSPLRRFRSGRISSLGSALRS